MLGVEVHLPHKIGQVQVSLGGSFTPGPRSKGQHSFMPFGKQAHASPAKICTNFAVIIAAALAKKGKFFGLEHNGFPRGIYSNRIKRL